MVKEGVSDHGHQGVAMKASPRSALEMIEAEFFLELLVRLLAGPAGLDRRGEGFEIGVGGEVGKIIFLLSGRAPLADEPDLFAWRVLHASVAYALRRTVGDAHANCGEAGFQGSLRSLAPTQGSPLCAGQHVFGLDGENIGHMPFSGSAVTGDRKDEFDLAGLALLMTRNADRPGKAARAQRLTELSAHAKAAGGEDPPQTKARGDQTIQV